jgi:hypothetical protein
MLHATATVSRSSRTAKLHEGYQDGGPRWQHSMALHHAMPHAVFSQGVQRTTAPAHGSSTPRKPTSQYAALMSKAEEYPSTSPASDLETMDSTRCAGCEGQGVAPREKQASFQKQTQLSLESPQHRLYAVEDRHEPAHTCGFSCTSNSTRHSFGGGRQSDAIETSPSSTARQTGGPSQPDPRSFMSRCLCIGPFPSQRTGFQFHIVEVSARGLWDHATPWTQAAQK